MPIRDGLIGPIEDGLFVRVPIACVGEIESEYVRTGIGHVVQESGPVRFWTSAERGHDLGLSGTLALVSLHAVLPGPGLYATIAQVVTGGEIRRSLAE